LGPLVAAVFAATLVGSACGQIGSTHGASVALADGSLSPPDLNPSPTSPSPNGENSGPVRTIPYQVIVQKSRSVKGFPIVKGPIRTCPVQGTGFFSDDFGAPRYAGGYHPHQGNDVFAEERTPIVSPFSGRAVADPNDLGGLAVKVFGPEGYVYNAHLVAYASKIAAVPVGSGVSVALGEVIGYVGNSGDAVGGPPHDHFEWHPANGPAVDPYPLLVAACAGG
jgi:murein DD-endopeptidase MepM/ murein hydrolase activator NlpD